MKTTLKTISYAVLIAVIAFLAWRNWQTEQALHRARGQIEVQKGLQQEYRTRYSKQVLESRRIEMKNDTLKMIIDDKEAQERAYIRLIGSYEARLADVETAPAETVTVVIPGQPSPVSVPQRGFQQWIVPEEAYIAGRFMTRAPFRISFDSLWVRVAAEILLAQDRYSVWTAAIDTRSPNLDLSDVQLQVVPYQEPLVSLRPIVDLFYWHFPESEIGLQVRARVWKFYPAATISSQRLTAGLTVPIYR